MIGFMTTIVPAMISPELTKLSPSMQAIPVEADNICRRIARQCWTGELLDHVQLFWWAPFENMDTSTTLISRLRELVS